MRNSRGVILSAILLGFTGVCAAEAGDYWVAPNGSDSNPGTQAQPFRQISRAIQVVSAGDTVHILDGTYNGGLTINLQGTANAPIVFKAEGDNAEVLPGGTDTIFITYSNYVVLDGINSHNANRAAVRIDWSNNITVRNGDFGNNFRWGIFTDFSDDLLLENNRCYGSSDEHGIYVSNSGDRPIVRGNEVFNNYASGIQLNADYDTHPPSGTADGIISEAVIENNIIYNNGVGGGAALNLDGVWNSVIRNNVLYNNHATGIALFRINGFSASSNNFVCNNTVDVAPDGRWSIHLGSGATGNKIFNNILVTEHSWRGSMHLEDSTALSGLVSDYNILTTNNNAATTNDDSSYLTFAQWQALGYDANSSVQDQSDLFTGSGDYTLKTGSWAVDSGTASLAGQTAPETDLTGGARPSGAGYDIGSYEQGSTPPGGTGGGTGGGSTLPTSGSNESDNGGGGGGGGCGGSIGTVARNTILLWSGLLLSGLGLLLWRRRRT